MEIISLEKYNNNNANKFILKLIKKHFNTQQLPPLDKIYISLNSKGDIVGTFTIEDNDLPGYDCPGPWLADLVIVPEYRKLGLSYQLVNKFIEIIGGNCYCWCSNSNYFNIFISCGFKIIDTYEDKTIFMNNVKL